MSADDFNFVTASLACCGFGCDTVAFVNQDDLNHPGLEKSCACIPRFWWAVEKILLIADLLNFVFDLFFVQKLRDEGHDTWATVLLCATITTFVGTMVVGRVVLNHVKSFEVTTRHIVFKEQVYYGYWSLMEVGAFLLEDASTLYLYFVEDGIFDDTNPLDVGNVYMSMFSGFVSLAALLLMTCTIYGWSKKCYQNLILFGIAGMLVAYPSYLTIHYSLPKLEDEEGIEFPEIALGVSSFLGYFFFAYLVFALLCHKCCADQGIEWPTECGMMLEGDLKSAHVYVGAGIGNPNNVVKGAASGGAGP